MALIRANFLDGKLCLAEDSRKALHAAALEDSSAPIILMTHGFKFQPFDPVHCPHNHIFSLSAEPSCRKAKSWPRALGFGQGRKDTGLAVAFGWQARGSLNSAYKAARHAGRALAELIEEIKALAPRRPIHAIGHSLGARVILQALHFATPGNLERIILLNPAEFRATAESALLGDAGRQTEALIVTSGENAIYDLFMSCIVWPERRGDVVLGQRLNSLNHVVTLSIDCPETLTHLDALGFPIEKTRRRLCHWSPYLREGTFALYSSVFRTQLPLRMLTPERACGLRLGGLAPQVSSFPYS